MRNKSINKFQVIVLLVVVVIGFTLGRIFSVPGIEIDKQLNPIDILSIGVTIILTYFVSKILDKEKAISQFEKDLINKRFFELDELVNTTKAQVLSRSIPLPTATSFIKRFSLTLQNICSVIEKIGLDYNKEQKEKLFINIRDLRNALTDTPFVNEDDLQNTNVPISVRDSIIQYNTNTVATIENKFEELKTNLFLFQLDFNRQQ